MSDPFDRDPDEEAEEGDSESYYGMDAIEIDPTAIDPPEASIPDSTAEFGQGDVDPEVRTLFWKVVIALKFTLLALTVGILLFVSGENVVLGRRVMVLGLVLAGYTAYQYRTNKRQLDEGEYGREDDPGGDNRADDDSDEEAATCVEEGGPGETERRIDAERPTGTPGEEP
ncbi:MAG: DUF7322 domain-containing protein [Natrialbaceae archaeon]